MSYNIYTLCRSGNHAIIFWILDNIAPITSKIDGCCYWNEEKELYYYNNCNHINYNFVKCKYLFKSYEDMDVVINSKIQKIL